MHRSHIPIRPSIVALIAIASGCTTERIVNPTAVSPPLPAELLDRIAASGVTGPVAVAEVLKSDGAGVERTAISPAIGPASRAATNKQAGLSFDIAPQDLLLILHPNGQKWVFFTSDTMKVIRWRFFCPTTPVTQLFNVDVQEVSQRAIQGTGGHGLSHTGTKPVAAHKHPVAKVPPDGAFFDTLVAERAAGDEVLSMRYVAHDQGSPCAEQITTQEFFTATRVEALAQIQPQSNMPLNVIDSDHSDLYWIIPEALDQVYQAANKYVAVESGVLTVTAATLPFGGLQDILNNWSSKSSTTGQEVGHSAHRIGTDVDYDGRADTQRVFDHIKRACRAAGFLDSQIHKKNHVHCYAVLY